RAEVALAVLGGIVEAVSEWTFEEVLDVRRELREGRGVDVADACTGRVSDPFACGVELRAERELGEPPVLGLESAHLEVGAAIDRDRPHDHLAPVPRLVPVPETLL